MDLVRLKKVRDLLAEVPDRKFNMKHWLYWRCNTYDALEQLPEPLDVMECSTAGCLAGWIAVVAKNDPNFDYSTVKYRFVDDVAVKYLGIETEKERHYLFSRPETYGCDVLQDVTKAQVIAKLDEILARGELS